MYFFLSSVGNVDLLKLPWFKIVEILGKFAFYINGKHEEWKKINVITVLDEHNYEFWFSKL